MTEQPKRIQRKRTKGWTMPDYSVYVGRPTKWGNPFPIGPDYPPALAVRMFWTQVDQRLVEMARRELRGLDLACWCPLNQPCHADVLLEIANR